MRHLRLVRNRSRNLQQPCAVCRQAVQPQDQLPLPNACGAPSGSFLGRKAGDYRLHVGRHACCCQSCWLGDTWRCSHTCRQALDTSRFWTGHEASKLFFLQTQCIMPYASAQADSVCFLSVSVLTAINQLLPADNVHSSVSHP